MSKEQGLRYNEGKLRTDLVPAFAQKEYVKVLTKGAQKYAERNWEKGMPWSTILSSMKRHIAAIEAGEDFDHETGLYHAAHVMCNAAFLTEYYRIYPQGDDRPHRYLQMPKIGLDIDEVICDWVNAWAEHWNLPTPTSWFFDRNIIARFEAMKADDTLEKFYMDLKPLISPADIPFEPHCYVTSRPVGTRVSEEWLATHGFPARPVVTVAPGESKAHALKEAGVEIFVDDRFENFVEINNAGICCFLMDAPHNQRYDVGHKRIYSLKDLIK